MTSSTLTEPKHNLEELKNYKALYEGVHMIFTNRFIGAEAHFAKHASEDSKLPAGLRAYHLVLRGFVKLFLAIATWGKQAIDKAVEVMWEAEALAATDTFDPLGAKLVQAHACLQGAFLQILQKRFAKAAWNIRSSWKYFQGAMADLESFEGCSQVRAEHEVSAKLGVGAFNLILSLMPPLIITVTKVLGFSADRQLGFKMLREAYSANRLMSPIAAQVLLAYFTTISSTLAEQTQEYREEAKEILKGVLKRHPKGVFLLWMKTSLLRSCRQHKEAIKCANLSESVCKDAPGLGMMSSWQSAWCSMLMLDWSNTKAFFLKILNSKHKMTQDGVPGFYCYGASLAAINQGELKEGEQLLERVESACKNFDLPHEQYSRRKSKTLLKLLKRERRASTEEYPDAFKCQSYMENIQLIVEWNFVKYMSDDIRAKVAKESTAWYERRKELRCWDDEQMAWYHLLMSHITFYDGDTKAAMEQGALALGYAKRAKPQHSTLLAQSYFFMSMLYLNKSPPDFKAASRKCSRAKEKCTGDLSKRMSFLLHALKARIAQLKKEHAEKEKEKKEKKNSKGEPNGLADANRAVSDETANSEREKEKETESTKNEEKPGMLSGAIGMVSGAVAWGWGAIGVADEESDDAIEEDKLEAAVPRPPTESDLDGE